MDINRFIQSSGFKVLSMARLSQCEYSLVLYLMNCSTSGLNQIVTTETELATLMNYDEDSDVRDALLSLSNCKIITLKYSDLATTGSAHPSMRIGLQFDITRWLLDNQEDVTAHAAIVYPFRRAGETPFRVLEGDSVPKKKPNDNRSRETWARIRDEFERGRSLDEKDLEHAAESAKILIETHPVDQVLIYLKHFSHRIPSLSLLASSWQHYQGLFEAETQKIDIMEARQKHLELDETLRNTARATLDKADSLELTEEDRGVLKIILNHKHPRRQLFWAFQLRTRYEKLREFFDQNSSIMIPITSAGLIIRKSNNLKKD